ncbi:hypothetical protein M9Y10_027714 [Tritrichomonas musculus]|uniref:Leucine-rich repeat domain-containing protein n=1 Tax=Tritrichomonas musculus TaxID=1915356 RepID=A0ABR2H3S2_9EUKA
MNKLEELIKTKKNDQEMIAINELKGETNKEMLEKIISSKLDDYLVIYNYQLFHLPLDSLYNIFTNPSRNLTKQDLAYELIPNYGDFDESMFKLLSTLDANKLSESNLNDSIIERKSRQNQIPKFDNLHLLDKMDKMKNDFKQISEYLCFNEMQNHQQLENISNKIKKAIDECDIEKARWLTRDEIEDENGVIYKIDRQSKKAAVFGLQKPSENVFIPRAIKQEGIEFIITTILDESFKENKTIKKFEFDQNSEIEIIGNVKIIKEFAFHECTKLTTVEIPKNSKLELIEGYSFMQSNIESLFIPSNLSAIKESAFRWCHNLKKIEISDKSKSLRVDKLGFAEIFVDKLVIPSQNIVIEENSKKQMASYYVKMLIKGKDSGAFYSW